MLDGEWSARGPRSPAHSPFRVARLTEGDRHEAATRDRAAACWLSSRWGSGGPLGATVAGQAARTARRRRPSGAGSRVRPPLSRTARRRTPNPWSSAGWEPPRTPGGPGSPPGPPSRTGSSRPSRCAPGEDLCEINVFEGPEHATHQNPVLEASRAGLRWVLRLPARRDAPRRGRRGTGRAGTRAPHVAFDR